MSFSAGEKRPDGLSGAETAPFIKKRVSLRSYFKIKHDHLPRQARDKQEHDSEAALKRGGELAGARASVAAADGAAQEHQRDDGGPGSAGAKTAFF
jgi:hypothetical protein